MDIQVFHCNSYLFTASKVILLIYLLFISVIPVTAQDERANLPAVLKNSYYEINFGYIDYPFGQESLEPGYTMESVKVPRPAIRLVLYGHEFNKYLSAQITYMRPVLWVEYTYTKDDPAMKEGTPPENHKIRETQQVWMNVAGLTLKFQAPVGKKFSIFGEAGLGIVTRNGFENDITKQTVIKDANYATLLMGGGVRYQFSKKFGLMLSMTYSPPNNKEKQPHTIFYSAGFSYKLLPPSEKQLEKGIKAGYIHPKQIIQIGFSGNAFGYDINNFFSQKLIIFWGGDVEVRHGLTICYTRNIFHTPKVFSFDWGVSFGYWQTNIDKTNFYTLSLFPLLRFTFLRTKPLDMYFFYSIAGPTFISKYILDYNDTGGHFTFQDNMGIGIFFGDKRNINAEVKIGHYSNGNLLPKNGGIKIPLTFNLGYAF